MVGIQVITRSFTPYLDNSPIRKKTGSIHQLSENHHIREIGLFENLDGKKEIYVFYRDNDAGSLRTDLELFAQGVDCGSYSSKQGFLDKFLSVFYEKNLIPDHIIDVIIESLEIPDFRMNTQRLIAILNEQIDADTSVEDFKTLALQELGKIADINRHQEITWGLIEDLKESNHDPNLLSELCELITESNLPCYAKAMALKAELNFTSDASESFIEKYRKTIIPLLEASTDPHSRPNLDNMVSHFCLGNVVGEDIPDELKSLTVSSESMFGLLQLIKKQKEELDKLNKVSSTT